MISLTTNLNGETIMRRSATEVINDLEMRIARLEKEAKEANDLLFSINEDEWAMLAELHENLSSRGPLQDLKSGLPSHVQKDFSKVLQRGKNDYVTKELLNYSKAVRIEQSKLKDSLGNILGI